MSTDTLTRSIMIDIVVGVRDALKLVFLIFPLFQECNSKGMDSKRTAMMTVAAFIVIFNRDKQRAISDINAIPITGERNSVSTKSNSSEAAAWRTEKPGRTKTNKIRKASERKDKPPAKNNIQNRKAPMIINVSLGSFLYWRCIEKVSAN